jgi:predicted CoA-binding protein
MIMTDSNVPTQAATDENLRDILRKARTVAVVGISHKEERDSHMVAKYLKTHGYKLIPVNPKYKDKEVLGEKCYASLKDIPGHVDIVDIFRNIDAIPGVVDEAIEIKAGCVWMQLGLYHEEAARKARDAGLCVIENRCMKIEHSRLGL